MANSTNKPAAPVAQEPVDGSPVALADGEAQPVTKKRKKKYSSRGLKFGQKAEVPLTRGAQRFARAVEEGLGMWRKKRKSSARKKRNGALRDALKNYGKAATRFQKVAARIPEEITRDFPKLRIFG
jgi:hypothetical protein